MLKSFLIALVMVMPVLTAFADATADKNALINAAVRAALGAASGKDPATILDSTPLCQVGTFGKDTIDKIDIALASQNIPPIDVSKLPIPEDMIAMVSCTITVEQLIKIIEVTVEKGH